MWSGPDLYALKVIINGDMAEYLDILENIEVVERLIRRQPRLQDRTNPMERYDDEGFIYRFRFPKHVVLDILQLVEGRLQHVQEKTLSVPPIMQLLITLQFYGSGTFLCNDADLFGVHISTVSRVIACCSKALASLYRQFINFPDQ